MSEPIVVTPVEMVWRPRFHDDGRRSQPRLVAVMRDWIERMARRNGWYMLQPPSVEFVRDPSMRATDVFVYWAYVPHKALEGK